MFGVGLQSHLSNCMGCQAAMWGFVRPTTGYRMAKNVPLSLLPLILIPHGWLIRLKCFADNTVTRSAFQMCVRRASLR
jgi:hypothetical protein